MTNLWGGLSSSQMQMLSDTKKYHEDLQAKMARGEIPPTGTVKPQAENSSASDLAQQNMMTLMVTLMMSQFMSMFNGGQAQQSSSFPTETQQPVYQPAQPWYQSWFGGGWFG